MPNIRQLEYLVALADTKHFRRAAELSNTSQPTLSEQLKALETRLGAQLVERSRSKVLFTPLGQQIVEIARRMLADASEIRMLAASGGRELSGVLRLGLPPTIGPYLLPQIIPTLHREYPDLKMYVREELPSQLPRQLEDGRHDVIITLLPVNSADVASAPLFREPLLVTLPADHPLAKKKSIKREELAGQDVLALGRGHQLHDVVLALCEEFGARLRFDYEGTSLDTLREMVGMGLGMTFLPGLYLKAVGNRDTSFKAVPLEGRSIYRSIGLCWRKTSTRKTHYEQLSNLLRTLIGREFTDVTVLS